MIFGGVYFDYLVVEVGDFFVGLGIVGGYDYFFVDLDVVGGVGFFFGDFDDVEVLEFWFVDEFVGG